MPVWPIESAIRAFIRLGGLDSCTSRRGEVDSGVRFRPSTTKPRAAKQDERAASRVVGPPDDVCGPKHRMNRRQGDLASWPADVESRRDDVASQPTDLASRRDDADEQEGDVNGQRRDVDGQQGDVFVRRDDLDEQEGDLASLLDDVDE